METMHKTRTQKIQLNLLYSCMF